MLVVPGLVTYGRGRLGSVLSFPGGRLITRLDSSACSRWLPERFQAYWTTRQDTDGTGKIKTIIKHSIGTAPIYTWEPNLELRQLYREWSF